MWKNLSRDDLARYNDKLETARVALLQDPDVFWSPNIPQTSTLKLTESEQRQLDQSDPDDVGKKMVALQIRKFPKLARSKSVSAMLHFTSYNWPNDFLQAYGIMEHHGGSSSGWSIVAPPRKLVLLVGVVENLGGSGAAFNLAGFSVLRSTRGDLRTLSQDVDTTAEELPFPLRRIGRGDRVVLPLRIELRQNTDVSPSSEQAERIANTLAPLPASEILSVDNESDKKISKTTRSFRAPEVPSVHDTYIFGPNYTIKSMMIDDREIPIRQLDPNHIAMIAGFEGGSCPVLYIRRIGFTEPVRIGTILRAARGDRSPQTAEIDLGSNAIGVIIAEEEPERLSISEIELIALSTVTQEKVHVLNHHNMVVDTGENLNIKFPRLPVNWKYVLRLTGYYETYGELMVNR